MGDSHTSTDGNARDPAPRRDKLPARVRLHAIVSAVAALLACAGWLWAQPATDQQQKSRKPAAKPVRVLFVGNSYTSAHDLPAIVRALGAASQPKVEYAIESITPGGFTLEAHLAAEGKDAPRARIAAGACDFVVLQEQSQRPILEPDKMLAAARLFAKELAAAKATPLWYATWARQAKPETQADLDKAYEACLAATGGRLAPVGAAWRRVLTAKDEKDRVALHDKDGSHPSAAGSYLAGLVIHATLSGGKLDGLPARLAEPRPKTGDKPAEERVLVELEPRVAKLLQQAATATLEARKKPR
jgi:hypothetical protein